MKAFGAFSARGNWYRGACHTHTKLSDGKNSAQELAAAYRAKGYDFLFFTDHGACQKEVASLGARGFLPINGVELSAPTAPGNPGRGHHIVALGIERFSASSNIEKRTAQTVIRWINRNGGIAVYGHPYWAGHDIITMQEGRSAFGMEVFNTVTAVLKGLGDASAHLDQALSRGFRWTAFAVDDTHLAERDAFGGWIMVKAPELTRKAIMGAIRRKHFYATMGPEIKSLTLKRGVVHITCSPVKEIVWHCEGPYGDRVTAGEGGELTAGRFNINEWFEKTNYLRVEVADSRGHKAWSNPIWRDRRRRTWTD